MAKTVNASHYPSPGIPTKRNNEWLWKWRRSFNRIHAGGESNLLSPLIFTNTFISLKVGNPDESVDAEDDSFDSVEFAQFKREIYHKVFDVIFGTLKVSSFIGEAVVCGDLLTRILHPGFLIHSVDGEEACGTCGTRGAKANHPCPRCLVSKENLYLLASHSTPRTQTNMKQLYHKAKALSSKTARAQLLKDSGLHLVKVSLRLFPCLFVIL